MNCEGLGCGKKGIQPYDFIPNPKVHTAASYITSL